MERGESDWRGASGPDFDYSAELGEERLRRQRRRLFGGRIKAERHVVVPQFERYV